MNKSPHTYRVSPKIPSLKQPVMDKSTLTYHASPKRLSLKEVERQYQLVMENNDLIVSLNSVASMVTILNTDRQIVFANKLVLEMVGTNDIHTVLGQRLGELFGCQHSFKVNGCGTTPNCEACGAVNSMLACRQEGESIDECSLTNMAKVTYDLRVHSTDTIIKGEEFIICSLFDISNEKRRGVMERIFFHDILNTINGINGIAQILPKLDQERQPLYTSHLTRLLNSLVDEVNSHRVLTMAEKDEYKVAQHMIDSLDFITEMADNYSQLANTGSKVLQITGTSEKHAFVTDKTLLSRVVGNMIKNALEAEPSGAIIQIGTRKVDGKMHFYVHNESVIPRMDSLKIFNRSFSTKGENRGLGTYSMKLLTEKYLNGTISFISRPDDGTIFTVKVPIIERK